MRMGTNTKKRSGEKIVWDIASDVAIVLMFVFIHLEWWWPFGLCLVLAMIYLNRYWSES